MLGTGTRKDRDEVNWYLLTYSHDMQYVRDEFCGGTDEEGISYRTMDVGSEGYGDDGGKKGRCCGVPKTRRQTE